MNNQEYWELRRAREMYQHMEEAEKLAKELDIAYRKAALYLQGEAEQILNKYQDKYNLTRAEAEYLLKNSNVPENVEELRRLLSKDKERYKELLQELETPAYKARIDNLANVYGQLDSIVLPMIANERRKHIALYERLAEDAYYQTIFDLQQYSGYGFDFKALDKKTIQKVLDTRWTAKSFSQSIWDNTHALAESVKREILINLLTGRPLVKAQQAIQEEFHSGSNAARRLVRTESAYVCNQLQIEGYKACGVERYIYVAILDLKTSQMCRDLDKEDFAVEDARVGLNYPPMHPWCRSTTIAYVSKELLAKMKQSAIDPATGKRITVPGDMTYKEWYKKYVKGNKTALAKEKAQNNTSLDKEQYEKYKEIFPDEMPDTLEKFKDLKYNNTKEWERFKAEKQDRINAMEFSEMQGLVGKLGNLESRLWYKSHIKRISEKIANIKSLEDRARNAFELRSEIRANTRSLMKDLKTKAELPDRNGTFEDLVKKKQIKNPSWSREQVLEDIIRSSQTSNEKYDRKAGINT